MNISIVDNYTQLRNTFTEKFASVSEDSLDDNRLLWEFIQQPCVSFAMALDFLRSLPNEVYFMSERIGSFVSNEIEIDGTSYQGIVAKADATMLADLIETEWYDAWHCMAQDELYDHKILPHDIYVFDVTMQHALLFTHETDFWQLEDNQPMRCAQSRFCKACGFLIPEGISYSEIKTRLEKDLIPHASFEIEISYDGAIGFRQFTISKWWNDSDTGYEYWFDFDPDVSYTSFEELENAKPCNDSYSLKEIAALEGIRFCIISVDGIEFADLL